MQALSPVERVTSRAVGSGWNLGGQFGSSGSFSPSFMPDGRGMMDI